MPVRSDPVSGRSSATYTASSSTIQSSASRKPNRNVKETAPPERHENITIRLSDLGIIKRSPSEVEQLIQHDRILYVLDKTIEKLQIALCLPHFLKNNCLLLRKYLQDSDVEFIQQVCLKYTVPHRLSLKSVPFQSISAVVDKISMYEPKRKTANKQPLFMHHDQIVDPHMAQVMEMLWTAHGLKEKAPCEFRKFADGPSVSLRDSIKRLKAVAAEKLTVTAREQRAREQQLSKAWKANSQAEENIEKIRNQLEKQRQELGHQVETKNALVTEYISGVEALNLKFGEDIKKKITESEKAMAEDSHVSSNRQSDLATEAKAATQQYEALLNQHLAYEKGLRAKRFKVETQLSSWLAKFDADIGERQAEFEELTKGYEEEKAQMEALKEKFDEQEEEYVVLMAEKEEEEQRIWEERAYVYLLNRSARKIQRYFRAYRQRKIDKKKAKKAKAKAKKEGEEGGKKPAAAEKKGGKDKKDGKNKKGGKDKKGKGKGKVEESGFRGADPMASLENKFGGELFGDLQGGDFPAGEVVVEL